VGLPLALTFADAGLQTVIYDTNRETVAKIRRGVIPFAEDGARELLRRALDPGGERGFRADERVPFPRPRHRDAGRQVPEPELRQRWIPLANARQRAEPARPRVERRDIRGKRPESERYVPPDRPGDK
jgi:UDP-N-acetyl-D-mannosaminuronate dehydrogenase